MEAAGYFGPAAPNTDSSFYHAISRFSQPNPASLLVASRSRREQPAVKLAVAVM